MCKNSFYIVQSQGVIGPWYAHVNFYPLWVRWIRQTQGSKYAFIHFVTIGMVIREASWY